MIDAGRAESFRTLKGRIAGADLRDDYEFRILLSDAQELLEMSDQEFADALRVSRPTVNRWIRGKNLPHTALRGPVCTWIDRQASERLKRLELFAQRAAITSAA